MEPYGNLSPLTGAQGERVDLDQTMEMSCNLNSIISQMMDIPAMSPPPTAANSWLTTSTCGPLSATTACSQGDKVIHPSHVKKKGLEAETEIDISHLETETVSRVQQCRATYVHNSENQKETTSFESSRISPATNVNPSTQGTFEGVGLVVDPALTNLPPELKNVDKVIILCNKDNLDAVLNRPSQIVEMPPMMSNNSIQPQKPEGIQVQSVEYAPLVKATETAKPLQEPLITQSYLEEVNTPDSFIDIMEATANNFKEASNEMTVCLNNDNIEFVYSNQTEVNINSAPSYDTVVTENLMTVKEEPAESFSVEQIKQLLGASSSFPQQLAPTEPTQTTTVPRVCVNMPWISQEQLNTPDDLLGNADSFDLLQYITKDNDSTVNELPQPSAENANPFQFPAVTADVQVTQPVKRKMDVEAGTSKRKKIEVAINPPICNAAQKTTTKAIANSRKSADKYDETRRKNNIASKRSRDNRKQRQQENERLLVELTETNESLTKKHDSLTKLVQTMQTLLFKSMGR